ncbi:transmembrane protein, putative (macronuclear) [Tetrahymena thermophila SB210]|uniref:Transmembrane protein, putative n=1 Tax=Tetrahymena thermophila (strain SB210) TaxID=312017 RepID=I7M0V6_TETTS|nr:transmembrane protein, putative [Tetrahymena thermophila SB210]EAR91018.1 transmembrane protein, putative [Tetrahymena thermophila SB210]|eukprot:XP_001011263.1 transmembrane protein, putative [Tetrahymena thermophila SB210]
MILRNRISKFLKTGSNLSQKKKIELLSSTFHHCQFTSFQISNQLRFFSTSSQPNDQNQSSTTSSSSENISQVAKSTILNHEDDNNFLSNHNIKEKEENNKNKKIFDLTPELKFNVENKDLLVDDYTNSPTHLKFSSGSDRVDDESTNLALQGFYQNENGLSINQKSELQLKDNPLALKVLTEGKIDIRDDRIIVNKLNTSDTSLLGNVEGLHQISLGTVDVLPQNSILLEDIDVNNIPQDKDIVIEKNTKVLLAVGKKVQKKKQRLTSVDSSEQDSQDKIDQEEDTTQKNSRNKYELSVNKKIFEELSLEEYKGKYLWNFEKDLVTFDFSMLMRSFLGGIPLVIVTVFLLDTLFELYKCKRDITLMEEQLINPYINLRRKFQADILLNDPLFDRRTLFPQEFNQMSRIQK